MKRLVGRRVLILHLSPQHLRAGCCDTRPMRHASAGMTRRWLIDKRNRTLTRRHSPCHSPISTTHMPQAARLASASSPRAQLSTR